MELKKLKQINNGMIPTEQPTIEEKVASGIGVEGTTGLSTLTDRKYINNLPKYSIGKTVKEVVGKVNTWGNESNAMFGSNAGAVMSAAPAAIDFVGSIGNATKYNKTADDLLQDAGSALGNIGGVSYQTQNEIDESQVAAQEHAENKANTIGLMGKGASLGASIGSVAGPVGGLVGGAVGAIGGLVGGLFGGGKRHAAMRRRVAEALNRALRQNDFSRNGALTSVLQLNYAREYGDTESQSLYGFKEGKPALMPSGEFVPNKMLTAWGSNGEVMVQRDGAGNVVAASQIGRGNDNKDTVPIVVDNNTEIYTNKQVEIAPGIKIRPSEYFKNTGDANGANYLTAMNIQRKKFKNGKLPGFSIGKWGVPEWANFTGNIIPMIATGTEYLRSKSEPLGSYTATHSNPNAGIASNMMLQRRYNPYPSYRNIWDLYAKNNYASNNSGLSSSQRNLLRTTNYANTLDNIYKINDHAQQMNNQYLGENAEFLDNQGRFNTQLRQTDDIKHYDTYTQSHGAADLRNSTLLSQFGNLFQNYSKGVSDLWTTRKILDYFDQQENEKRKNNTTQYPSFTIDLSARDYVLGNLKYNEDDLNSDLRQHNIMPKPITQEELNARQMVPGTPTYFKDIELYLLKKATKLRKKSTNRKKS